MIRKPDSDHRSLSLPAIQAGDSIAQATLLSSLINHSRKICSYSSKFNGCNKRNAIDSIRQITILLAFFEEIQDSKSKHLPDSVVLALSELNSILHKILHLLEDCALEGPRLLMLMKSDLIAIRFRNLIRSVASALKDLRFDLFGVPIEVIEHVELMMKQARRAKFEVDREDVLIHDEVKSILTDFRYQIIPDNAKLKRVLDYIGIRQWSSCNNVVKFLELEIEIQWSGQDKRELSFLNDLVSLMNFSRCVLFDDVDFDFDLETNTESRVEIPNCLNPDEFLCPISLDYMIDPVMIATGQTYDRSSIQKWLLAGNSTCPYTRKKLINTGLVPNLSLRRIIRQYCSENSITLGESVNQNPNITRVDCSCASESILRVLAKYLGCLLKSGTVDEKNKVVYEIKLLSNAINFTHFCAAKIDLVPNLLKLLSSSNALTQKNTIEAVSNLSWNSKCKRVIAENNGLEEIVNVLRDGHTVEARQLAADALFFMAFIEDYRKFIVEIPGAMLGLMNLLKHDNDRSKKNAMVAISRLMIQLENRGKVLAAGAVPLLMNLVETSSCRECLVADSMEILEPLAREPGGTVEILRCGGGLNSIVEFLGSCSSRIRQKSASLLVALCVNGGNEVIDSLSKNKKLISTLNIMTSQGLTCFKTNALIRVLNEYYELFKLKPN